LSSFAELTRASLRFCIRAYQLLLSPLLGQRCRFHPTCSHYALEAIDRHGAARGAALAVLRIARCQPFARGGIDPVPEHFTWRPWRQPPSPPSPTAPH
jgi:uncharacterized protein